MCDPATAMAALQVVGGVVQYQQASAQADAHNAQAAQNRVSATQARDLKIRQLALRNAQEAEANNEEKRALALDAMRLKARASVAAGEAGVAGNSVDALLRGYDADLLRGLQQIDQESDALNYQLSLERQGLEAEAMNRIASIQPVSGPDPLAAAVGVAANAAGSYASFGGDLSTPINKLSTASGAKYDTGFFSEQSRMLAAQEF